MNQASVYPVVPLRDVVVFPAVATPLFVGRPRSIASLESAMTMGEKLVVLSQKDPKTNDPGPQDLFEVGTLVQVRQITKLGDGSVKFLAEGLHRVKINHFTLLDPILTAEVMSVTTPSEGAETLQSLIMVAIRNFEALSRSSTKSNEDFISFLKETTDPEKFIAAVQAHLTLSVHERQDLLESRLASEALEKLTGFLMREIEVIKLDKKIRSRVRDKIEKHQRDFYLQEQLQAIHKELGDDNDPKSEVEEFEKRLSSKKMPDAARERAQKEIKRFKASSGHPAESVVNRNYIELLLDLPWNEYSADSTDIQSCEAILDRDHDGLREIKDRIVEYLAVRIRTGHHRSPTLCLSGPPGVGKTSLAKSIASALGRKFEKISLGGLRDEAELRGHRRTYIGSLPGKIITAIKNSGCSNPVILLDEIDKIGRDFRGDPTSVLLEVLDPEQNTQFSDLYLDLPYDLSQVLFVATANSIDHLPTPLLDRLEVIRLSGYQMEEKVRIAQRFLLPREKENHGLSSDLNLMDQREIEFTIESYTREAGVRGLQKEIAKLSRRFLRDQIRKNPPTLPLKAVQIQKYLGVPRYRKKEVPSQRDIGIVNGLAWTPSGGDTLTIETNVFKGRGKLQITGQVGKVMQESVKAALSFSRTLSAFTGVSPDYFFVHDFHVHIPEGAIPKDGPSAGIAITTAILSSIMHIPVSTGIAMTGEITLRGKILPVGGLKEKILAAQRNGIKKILYPKANEYEVTDLLSQFEVGLDLVPVSSMRDVIPHVFENIQPDHTLEVKALDKHRHGSQVGSSGVVF